MRREDLLIDGCDLDFSEDAVADEDIDGIVLFADLAADDEAAIQARVAEWEALSNGS